MLRGVTIFRLSLCVAWVVLLAVTVRAVTQGGLGAAGDVFFGDFAHPWRAQFNADFALYLVLVAAWIVYRSRSRLVGLVFAVLAINLGGLFTLAYLLLASFEAKGDVRKLLLGRAAAP